MNFAYTVRVSLVPRPPPFLPSVCIHNNTWERNQKVETRTGLQQSNHSSISLSPCDTISLLTSHQGCSWDSAILNKILMHTLVRYRSASVEFCTLTLVLECDTVIVHCSSWRQTPWCHQDHEAVGQWCYIQGGKEKIKRTLSTTKNGQISWS